MKLDPRAIKNTALFLCAGALAGCSFTRPETKTTTSEATPPAISAPVKREASFAELVTMLEPHGILDKQDNKSNLIIVISSERHASTSQADYAQAQFSLFKQHIQDAERIGSEFKGVTLFMEGNHSFDVSETRSDMEFASAISGAPRKFTDAQIKAFMMENPVYQMFQSATVPVRGLEGPGVGEITNIGVLGESYYAGKAKIVDAATRGPVLVPIGQGQTPSELFQIDQLKRARSACKTEAGKNFPIIPHSAFAHVKRIEDSSGDYLEFKPEFIKALSTTVNKWLEWRDTYSLDHRNIQWVDTVRKEFAQNGKRPTVAFVVCGINHVDPQLAGRSTTFPQRLAAAGISYIVLDPIAPIPTSDSR